MDLLEAGINVISAVNIQHIESLNEDIKGLPARRRASPVVNVAVAGAEAL